MDPRDWAGSAGAGRVPDSTTDNLPLSLFETSVHFICTFCVITSLSMPVTFLFVALGLCMKTADFSAVITHQCSESGTRHST